ncbi:hypothetical protein B5K05_07485 [Rhizobium phaseoli]|uniref:Uncharacterized protein n=1 Tax=Rhizobium etli (strain CIAT 652) TaxID=491916 RepID=B3PSS5_RHIE6|nr:hypothetical protein RHECIAT_CH0001106 [Rhizobium etli CIAT 652]KKZ87504.1 hypothetical protein RPHASCH2410_CH12085 [Rhizobium phaseoli Ch24-10]PDS70173.1 hypothetical protein CO651_19415 [Rhizobium phaseoli]RDJ14681.1 hypothetical protein B5K04_07445 [Rhizobium phaseoli]RDJ17688.1 hypothetical protein B5K05_07485 [Rhizobium phaseoli]
MMPKSVKRFSDDIMLYFFDSDPRPARPEIIRIGQAAADLKLLSRISAGIPCHDRGDGRADS